MARWRVDWQPTHHGRVTHDGTPVSRLAMFAALASDAQLQATWHSALLDVPFVSFRWETAPLSPTTADLPFEFAVIDEPALQVPSDPSSFAPPLAAALARGEDPIAQLPNLRGDALLIVPQPRAADYGHLAAFLRNAPPSDVHALWSSVGTAAHTRSTTRPIWVSTAGLGVPWLHVRLDDRPKYYVTAAYRRS